MTYRQTIRQIEAEIHDTLRKGGGHVDMLGAGYLSALIRATNNDEIDDDEFFNGLDLLRTYLVKGTPR